MAIQDSETQDWTVPYVIEPSAGVDRGVLAVLNEAYKVEKLEDNKERIVLAFKPHLAPIKAAVIPLKKNNYLPFLHKYHKVILNHHYN